MPPPSRGEELIEICEQHDSEEGRPNVIGHKIWYAPLVPLGVIGSLGRQSFNYKSSSCVLFIVSAVQLNVRHKADCLIISLIVIINYWINLIILIKISFSCVLFIGHAVIAICQTKGRLTLLLCLVCYFVGILSYQKHSMTPNQPTNFAIYSICVFQKLIYSILSLLHGKIQ